jgi:cysteine desulfurase
MTSLYLDAAATTSIRREVLEAMWPHLIGAPANPSSTHEAGSLASRALDDARSRVAAVFGARSSEAIFTSGGTEADNLAIKGIALASPRGRHIVVSAIEHPAVLESCAYLRRHHGFEVTVVGVDTDGLVDPVKLRAALRSDTTLCSVMFANNEVGTIQPIAELAAIGREGAVPFHTDAVQAVGWLDCSLDALGVDAVSISGHKLGAPHGIGALIVRGRIPLEAQQSGGAQERGRRSGTQNVAGAVGFATALELAVAEGKHHGQRVSELRDAFIAEVLATVPDATLTGALAHRLPGSASFCFPGTSGETILLELEAHGISSSSGSACAAGNDEPSAVLIALGIAPEVAQTAVRFTFGAGITADDLSRTARELRAAVARVRGLGD